MRGFRTLLSCTFFSAVAFSAEPAPDVAVLITTDGPRTAISPLIYGSNHDLPGLTGISLRRWGGNSTDTYNWENNCNNAGNDWQQANVRWQARAVPPNREQEPAAGISVFHEESIRQGVPSLINLPLVGYVAADDTGPVSKEEAPPSRRWKRIVINKGAPLSDTPDLKDDVVYLDEMVAYLVHKFGPASGPTGIKYWSIGNEPGLWTSTHPLIWLQKPTCREYMERAIAAARMVKRIDPSAKVVGPSAWNIIELVGFSDAPDWPEIKQQGGYRWFLDYFLSEFRRASEKDGRRLLDVYSIHCYAENELEKTGGQWGIMQSPRTLWEPGYHELSWIGESQHAWLPILPKVRASIERCYPGTEIGVTEFDRQMPDDVAGGIATADTLGIFADQKVALATLWPLDFENPNIKARYEQAAYALYRNFDGAGAKYGDAALLTTASDSEKASVHASVDTKTGDWHVILLNKQLHTTSHVRITLQGATGSSHAVRAFGFDAKSPMIHALAAIPQIEGNSFVYEMPERSAAHLIISAK